MARLRVTRLFGFSGDMIVEDDDDDDDCGDEGVFLADDFADDLVDLVDVELILTTPSSPIAVLFVVARLLVVFGTGETDGLGGLDCLVVLRIGEDLSDEVAFLVVVAAVVAADDAIANAVNLVDLLLTLSSTGAIWERVDGDGDCGGGD